MEIVYTPSHALHAPGVEMSAERGGFQASLEVPPRADRILAELTRRKLGPVLSPQMVSRAVLTAVHDPDLLTFLSTV